MRFSTAFSALALATLALAASPAAADPWADTLAEARGQTVYFNAWGGDTRTNDFLAWVGQETERLYGVKVQHVKLTDTAEAVTRVLAEKTAGQDTGGSIDLIWINGPNFLAMKQQGLLHGPFVDGLPNARFVDLTPGAPATRDFTVPVDGMESPWRLAKFVFVADTARVSDFPADMAGFVDWAAAHPGRMTHPDAGNFMGATFLKQALVELAPDPAALQAPPTDESYAKATAPLWAWYDALRPNLWQQGREFPADEGKLTQMLNDGAVDVALSFDPASTAAFIDQGLLPETARVFVPKAGSIGNISFVAIPYNAAHQAGAKVVADFLLAPSTQAHAQDIRVLGSFSVLDPARLGRDDAAVFDALPAAPALPKLQDLGATLPEPHPDWMTRVAADWAARVTQ